MSFERQERALFALLFDEGLRERFVAQGREALASFELSDDELADLTLIRPDALMLDARLRRDLILQKLCRALPLTFSLASSLAGGLDATRRLIDLDYVHASPLERVTRFGRRLERELSALAFSSDSEKAACLAIIDAELSLNAITSARRADPTPERERPDPSFAAKWDQIPLALAPHVCAVLMPLSHTALMRALCPCPLDELWARLEHAPLPASRRRDTLVQRDPRLLVARAFVTHRSRCEANVDRRIFELSEGFAPMFRYLDGSMSVRQMLAHLRRAGAPDAMLGSVRSGFSQLVQHGALVPATTGARH
jgi:hypothetical protein